jgi:hypothetical protein
MESGQPVSYALRASALPPSQTCLRRWRRNGFHFDSGVQGVLLRIIHVISWLAFLFRRGALFPYIIGKRANKFASAS